jgi:hypothetical protein
MRIRWPVPILGRELLAVMRKFLAVTNVDTAGEFIFLPARELREADPLFAVCRSGIERLTVA